MSILERIAPRRCEIGREQSLPQCEQTAEWQYNGVAVCQEDMQAMSRMNSDNEAAFAPALDPRFSEAIEDAAFEIGIGTQIEPMGNLVWCATIGNVNLFILDFDDEIAVYAKYYTDGTCYGPCANEHCTATRFARFFQALAQYAAQEVTA